jgi:hypothetical protein
VSRFQYLNTMARPSPLPLPMKNGERETTASVFFCAVTPAGVSLSPLAGRGWGEGLGKGLGLFEPFHGIDDLVGVGQTPMHDGDAPARPLKPPRTETIRPARVRRERPGDCRAAGKRDELRLIGQPGAGQWSSAAIVPSSLTV